jgi:hypothetical protein
MFRLSLTWSMEELAYAVCRATVTGWTARDGYTYARPRTGEEAEPPAR